MKIPALAAVVLAGSLATACSRQVPLVYVPTNTVAVEALPAIGRITVVDNRGESDPTWIGAIRGGYGNSLKAIHTARPLADMVTDAFSAAVAARGLLARPGAGVADMAVTIAVFDGTKYIRSEADIDLALALRDRSTGRPLYADEVKSNPVTGSVFALDNGIFASPDDLQAVVQKAMNQAIDAALDKPGFVAALRAGTPPQS